MPVNATSDRDFRETIAVGATVSATVLAAIYWISRIGFANPVAPVVEALGLSLFLIVTPLWISRWIRDDDSGDWWASQPLLGLACVVLTVLAGVIAGHTGLNAGVVIAATGIGLGAWTLARWFRRGRILTSLAFIAGASVFTVWCAGVIWGSRYKMPLFWETMSFNGNLHHDPFYLSAMANMLETYGVPTTGLDGIPAIHYHFGSPWMFAKWGHLIGVDTLTFYSLGYPVVVLPLFFASLLLLTAELRAAFGASSRAWLRGDWRVWLVFLAATAGLIPTRALDALAVWNSNAFISESYLIAMAIMFLVFGIAVRFWRADVRRSRETMSSWGFLIEFLPLTIALLGFLKISQMMLSLGLAAYLFVRLRFYRRPVAVASIAATLVLSMISYRIVSLPEHDTGLSPLHFMRFDAAQGWQQFFPLIHFLWTWVYIGMRIWEEGARDWSGLITLLKSRRLIDAEILAVFAILAFLPGEIVSIHGGSAVYFSDAQRWLALSFIAGRMPLWVERWHAPRDAKRLEPAIEVKRGWRDIRLKVLLGAFVAAPFAITLLVNLSQWPIRVLRTNITLRRELAAQGGEGRSTYYPIVTVLRDISRLPTEERRRALLFIPQSSTQYWSMFTADDRCTFTPLIAPAIASVAMLDGMPAFGCAVTNQYNMPRYQPRTRPQTKADVTDAAVCSKARARGFSEVLVLDAPKGIMPRRRRIDC
jgi:hypothetical protein